MGLALYFALALSSIAAAIAILALACARAAERAEQQSRQQLMAVIGGLRADLARAAAGRGLPVRPRLSVPFHLAPAAPAPQVELPERRVVPVTTDDDPIHTRKTVKMAPGPWSPPGTLGEDSDDDLSDTRETIEVSPSSRAREAALAVDEVTRSDRQDPVASGPRPRELKAPRNTILGIGEGGRASVEPPARPSQNE